MSLFQSLFGVGAAPANPGSTAAPAGATTTGVTGTPAAGATGTTTPGTQQTQQTNIDPSVAALATAGASSQSPLDKFAEIWQTPANGGNVAPNFASDAIAFDQNQMQAIRQKVSSINFMASAKPETVQAALTGNVEAFSSVINSAVQQALLQSMQLSGAMVNQGLRTRAQELMDHFPEVVRQQLASQQLRQDNPLFSNPATKPILESLEAALVRNQPNLTPQQVSQVAQTYLQDFAKTLMPQATTQQKPSDQPSWDTFFK